MNIFLKLLVPTLFVFTSACMGVGKFEIVELDSRFEVNGARFVSGKNNRISTKSIAGGFHIDSKGVFVNPVMGVSADSTQSSLALNISNFTEFDTKYGAPNTLGQLRSITFLVNSETPIQLDITDAQRRSADLATYNQVSQSASRDIVEVGTAKITPNWYYKIAYAQSVAVKIIGSKRSVVYEAEEISPDFLANLRQFYELHISQT